MKKLILVTLLILMIAFAVLAQNNPENSFSGCRKWTEALCDSQNRCEDYIMSQCNDTMTAIPTGYVVQHSSVWVDFRR